MVLPDSHGVARAPWYSGICSQSRFGFVYGGVTLYAAPSQVLPLPQRFFTLRQGCNPDQQTLQHQISNACMLTLSWFRLVPVRSPLLRESRLISIPPGTEMFQFPGLAPLRVHRHDSMRVSPFGHPRVNARLPARRGVSQAPASFIAF